MQTTDTELMHYKKLPMAPLAAAMGWTKRENCGDKELKFDLNGGARIDIFRGSSGDWLWKSHDGSMTGYSGKQVGTVVDLAYHIERNLGKARGLLRSITGYNPDAPTSSPSAPSPVSVSPSPPSTSKRDPQEIEKEYLASGDLWMEGQPMPFFMQRRGLGAPHEIFQGLFRVSRDRYENVSFPYTAYFGPRMEHVGYEKKGPKVRETGKSFTQYSKGSEAGIWFAGLTAGIHGIVVCESPIDCMSLAAIMPLIEMDPAKFGFIALRSGAEDHAVKCIKTAVENFGGIDLVLLATDNDASGMLYAHKVMAGLHNEKVDVPSRYIAPPRLQNDWNDALLHAIGIKKTPEKHPAEYIPEEAFDVAI